jgi:hypothetical protein
LPIKINVYVEVQEGEYTPECAQGHCNRIGIPVESPQDAPRRRRRRRRREEEIETVKETTHSPDHSPLSTWSPQK